MRLIKILLILFFLNYSVNAEEGGFQQSFSAFMPSLMEIQFVVAVVNTYMQASSLIRATNRNIELANQTVEDIEKARNAAKRLWGDLQKLKSINIYDMDSWADWIDNADKVTSSDAVSLLDHLNTTLDRPYQLTFGYMHKVENGLSYDITEAPPNLVFHAYYYQRDFSILRNQYHNNNRSYKEDQLQAAMLEKNQLALEAENAGNVEQARLLRDEAELLRSQLDDVRDGNTLVSLNLKYEKQLETVDSIVTAVSDQLPLYYSKIATYKRAAKSLATRVQIMITGRVPKKPAPTTPTEPVKFTANDGPLNKDGSSMYSDSDANKTKTPTVLINEEDVNAEQDANERLKNASLIDFQYARVEAALISMKQEELLLDMETTILAAEIPLFAGKAYDFNKGYQNGIDMANGTQALAWRIGKSNNVNEADIENIFTSVPERSDILRDAWN